MTENRLKDETSPYLLQHKDNPVHWWAWGPEALAEAKRTGKPILLSVGYAACHWCHVMAHESFEDPATAEVMNAFFVNIKVDREERPDIDAIYMTALHALGEQGGWPLTMFLDSEARPFYGGTYFPKNAHYGRPAFVTVLLQVAEVYNNAPEKIRHNAESLMRALTPPPERESEANSATVDEGLVRRLVERLVQASDPTHGGLRGAPKFPQWNVLWLLWRAAMRFGDDGAKSAVEIALTHMCQGGIYDHLGGGFARYSVDETWLVPHFEKMLYDNALLIDLMTEVWRETQNPLLALRVQETVTWLDREMVTPGGGFAASLDADSEGEEGKFYVWSAEEIAEVLGAEEARVFNAIYGVTPEGNFEGANILNRLDTLTLLSADEETRLTRAREQLLARRSGRIRPGFDDKVLADWNGLMIAALARAGVVFQRPDWVALARNAFAFVVKAMHREPDRLWHSTRAGRTTAPATASDYAAMIWAALRLYQATGDAEPLDVAKHWAQVLDRDYWDEARGGYFTAASDTADVIVRLRSAHDDAVPSANTLQLANLTALASLTGDVTYQDRAESLYNAFRGEIARSPAGHCGLLAQGLDMNTLVQIHLPDERGSRPLQTALHRVSLPGALEFLGNPTQGSRRLPSPPPGLEAAAGGALVCVGPTCGRPVSEPAELTARLHQARQGVAS